MGKRLGRPPGSKNRPGSKKPGPRDLPDDFYVRTLQEIADTLGVSRQAGEMMQKRALAKVRAALEERGIDQELWLSHLADLHKRQRTAYSVSGDYVAVSRFRSIDEAEEAATCGFATAE